MKINNLIDLIDKSNSELKDRFIDFLDQSSNPIDNCAGSHLTVSALIVYQNNILVIYHQKLGKYIQLGGHFENTLCPYTNIRREVFEESNLKPDFVTYDILNLNIFDISNKHRHYDICFLMQISKIDLLDISSCNDLKFFSFDEILKNDFDQALKNMVLEYQKLKLDKKARINYS